MAHGNYRNWLIAYDIADPRRLGRVHRYLKQKAIPVQYSVFVFRGNQFLLDRVLRGIADRIEPEWDDVRAYHLPGNCKVAALGRQHLPDGIQVAAPGMDGLLHRLRELDAVMVVEDFEDL